MKPGSILLVAFLAPSLFCLAQDKAPAAQETAKPVAPDAPKPAAQETAKPVAPDAPKPAAQEATKPVAPDAPKPVVQDTARPAAPDAAKVAVTDSYVIGATDVLAVSVFKEPTLSSSILVRPDGMISMPLLGDVQASGKTPLQLADEITAKLKKYVQDPNVTVILNQMNSKKVYLMGEIGHTGPIEMTPGMTLLQAIATGGGLNPYANAKKMYILRVEGGKQLKIPVQYKQALKGDLSFNLILNSGDTIVVP